MELKVVCYCGQKYKFDVEPVEGRMPFTVNCPVCNVDGTPLANQLLREKLSGIRQPAPIAAAPPITPIPAPAPPAPAPMAAPPLVAPLPAPAPAVPAPVAAAASFAPLPSAAPAAPASVAAAPSVASFPAPAPSDPTSTDTTPWFARPAAAAPAVAAPVAAAPLAAPPPIPAPAVAAPAPVAAAPLVAPLPAPAPVAAAPSFIPPPMPAPAVAAPVAATRAMVPPLPAAPAAAGGGVRVKMSAQTPPPLAAAAMPPPLAVTSAPQPLSASAPTAAPKPIAAVKTAAAPKVQKNFSLGLGVLGAFLGAAIGGGLVYGFFALLNFRFPWTGVAVGALVGYGARLLARGTDTTLGYIAGALALVATAGAFYLIYLEFNTFYVTAAVSVLIGTGVAYKLASE